MKKECITCGNALKYEGDLGAPGVGQSWVCTKCGESHWVHAKTILRFTDLEPNDVITNEWE